jgi:hypothetical protein
MTDLSDELRSVAADAASQARPMAIADVIRRGNRRRRRTITQRSIGGLSVAGLSAVAIFTGTAGHLAAPASSSTAGRGVTTLTQTASSSAGMMTIRVKYQGPGLRHVRLISLSYSGHSNVKVRHPVLIFTLASLPRGNFKCHSSTCTVTAASGNTPPGGGKGSPGGVMLVIALKRSELGHFSGSVHVRLFNHSKPQLNSTLTAALANLTHSKKYYGAAITMQDGMILG